MTLSMLRAAIAGALLLAPAPVAAAGDARETVIAAATSFSVGYGAWLWEKNCKTLTAEQRADYDAVIADALKRLQDASDDRLFNAAVGSGRDVASDPKFAACTGPDVEGFASFGLDQARESLARLKTLPPGFRLVITD